MATMTGAQPTLADSLWPAKMDGKYLRLATLAICGSAFIAVMAQIQVPLKPVPITMQTFAVLVIGAANSSNSNRLREVVQDLGIPSFLINGPEEIPSTMLHKHQRLSSAELELLILQ